MNTTLLLIGLWFISLILSLIIIAGICAAAKTETSEEESRFIWWFSILLATAITFIAGGIIL